MVVDVQSLEEVLVAFEQRLQSIHQQALAEPARTRQEIVPASLHPLADKGHLVDVVAVIFSENPAGLEADREQATFQELGFG